MENHFGFHPPKKPVVFLPHKSKVFDALEGNSLINYNCSWFFSLPSQVKVPLRAALFLRCSANGAFEVSTRTWAPSWTRVRQSRTQTQPVSLLAFFFGGENEAGGKFERLFLQSKQRKIKKK